MAALLAPPRPRVPGPGVGVEPGLALELETKVHAKGIIMEKAPTRAFSWLKARPKWVLTPLSLNVKLGQRHKSHKGWAVWLAWCLIAARPL